MPARSKRSHARRSHAVSQEPSPANADLLSLSPPDPPHAPAVFEPEPPPSDPEIDRAPTAIWDTSQHLLHGTHEPEQEQYVVDYSAEMYHPRVSGSSVDGDDGPVSVSPSISPPDSTGMDPGVERLAQPERMERSMGHIRAPVLAREPTTLESFSRTIRNYVPSSIPIPTAGPSPPRVSRPVSFGSFLTPSPASTSSPVPSYRASPPVFPQSPPTIPERDEGKRRGSDARRAPRHRPVSGDMAVFSLDDDENVEEDLQRTRTATTYPSVGETEDVLWAGWDTLEGVEPDPAKPRSVLLLGYPTGVQIWDCTNLGTVSELLNLSGPRWGSVDFAGVLPTPNPASGERDLFESSRPLIGFLSRTGNGSVLVVYSLRTHDVVQQIALGGLESFAASGQFIALSTSTPAAIHIFSARKLTSMYTIATSSLVPFAYPSPFSHDQHINHNDNINVSTHIDIEGDDLSHTAQPYPSSHRHTRRRALPHPVYALSGRLLAYVAPLAPPELVHRHGAPSPTQNAPHAGLPVPRLSMATVGNISMPSQAELGSAAAKLGGSVLSGMRTLGGLAISAARAGVAQARQDTSGTGGLSTMFGGRQTQAPSQHSRRHSTPDGGASGRRDSRSLRVSPSVSDQIIEGVPTSSPQPAPANAGCKVVVVDLLTMLRPRAAKKTSGRRASLAELGHSEPETVTEVEFKKQSALAALSFAPNGTALAVCSKDGHAVRVVHLRPLPRAQRAQGANTAEVEGSENSRGTWNAYNLRRGRTHADVDGLAWAHDRLWFAMGSRKRTIHVFATNPNGGKPDGSSHLAGRVVNSAEQVSWTTTDVAPLVRVRLKPRAPETAHVPTAFTFIRSSAEALPPSLLPPASVHFSASSSPSSLPSVHSNSLPKSISKPVSPAQRPSRPTNFKDMLVFDPAHGTLTLHRVVVERPSAEGMGMSILGLSGSIPVPGGMSISLPGMSTLGSYRMGGSPTTAGGSGGGAAPSPLSQMVERERDVVGKESVVGTWSLVRGRDWAEVRQSVRVGERKVRGRVAKADWLSRAELSTYSSSPRVLPRSIYLSHQFSFHALGEDYHALIRSHHFEHLPGTRIEVRKPIAINAFPSTSPTFAGHMHDLSSPTSHTHTQDLLGSSFDEPLASALAAPLPPVHASSPVLPMLPNGTQGRSLMNAIPIRTRTITSGIQDGVSAVRRELAKGNSSGTRTRQQPSVPLEFDEEDEDFLREPEPERVVDREPDVLLLGAEFSDAAIAAEREMDLEPVPAEMDEEQGVWQGWSAEDKLAVEEAERFDDITVGFMDEEQESMRAPVPVKKGAKKVKKRR